MPQRCNNKLIGARSFDIGAMASNLNTKVDSHTASTTVGEQTHCFVKKVAYQK